MRNFLGIGLALAAVSGCTGGQPLQTTSSTQGTTTVRTAVVTRVTLPAGPDTPTRLQLRYDNGATSVVETRTAEVFNTGDKVRVTHSRGTEQIERLDGR